MSLKAFAAWLGLPERHAEEALHSADSAKLLLTRRLFLGTVGATAAVATLPLLRPKTYSFAAARPFSSVHLLLNGEIIQRWEPGQIIRWFSVPASYALSADPELIELRRVGLPGFPITVHWKHPLSRFTWQSYDESSAIIC